MEARMPLTNEQEWRAHLLKEIEATREDVAEIKQEITTLKVKVTFFSSIIASVATFIATKIFH